MHTENEIKIRKASLKKEHLITIPTFIVLLYMCYLLTLVPGNSEVRANNSNDLTTNSIARLNDVEATTQALEAQSSTEEVESQLRSARVTLELRGKNSISVGSGTLVSINDELFVLTAEHVVRTVTPGAWKTIITDTINHLHINVGSISVITDDGVRLTSSENNLMICETKSTGMRTSSNNPLYQDGNGFSIDGVCAIRVTEEFDGYADELKNKAYKIPTEDSTSEQSNTALFINEEGVANLYTINTDLIEETIIPLEYPENTLSNIPMVCPGNSGSPVVIPNTGEIIGVVIIANRDPENITELHNIDSGCWPSGYVYNSKTLLDYLTLRSTYQLSS